MKIEQFVVWNCMVAREPDFWLVVAEGHRGNSRKVFDCSWI